MRNYSWCSLLILMLVVLIFIAGGCFTINIPQSDGQLPASGGGTTPVINTFSSSPINITPGSSATLSWQVTGANTVSIDNGIGSVSLNGSRSVTPVTTTIYTLTATGPGGSHTATVQITVGTSASSGTTTQDDSAQPPLGVLVGLPIINSFTSSQASGAAGSFILSWNVSNASSIGIVPGIGTVDPVGAKTVTPTAATTYILSARNAYGVREKSVTVTPFSHLYGTGGIGEGDQEQVAYDFIQKAPLAYWYSSDLRQELSFPGSSNSNGFVCYKLNTKLSDGVTYTKLLETHPRYVDNGYISGEYRNIYVPPGSKLKVKVGIINGASSGKVRFAIYNCCPKGNPWLYQVVAYSDGVKTTEVDLGAFAGQTLDHVTLNVTAEGVSTQDWAAWAEAKIVH